MQMNENDKQKPDDKLLKQMIKSHKKRDSKMNTMKAEKTMIFLLKLNGDDKV